MDADEIARMVRAALATGIGEILDGTKQQIVAAIVAGLDMPEIEITNEMLTAGLAAMHRTMRPDTLIDDYFARDRVRIVTAIFRDMLAAAKVEGSV